MIDDFLASALSTKQIEQKALAWRHALGLTDERSPDILVLLERRLPRIFADFALTVRADDEMGDAEAYTEFNPPHITVRDSVYQLARRYDGRSRMTLAHELGHLVMHPGAAKLRMESGNRTPPKIRPYESAEWQARKFAAFFLLPTHVVRQFGSAREVADSCQVSLQAAEIRCNEVGHIKRHASPCVEELISDIDALQTKGPTLRKV